MGRKEVESAVTGWLADRHGEMVALLEELVNADSGSYDKAGVDAAGLVLQRFLEKHGLAVDTIPHAVFGDALRATLAQPGTNDPRPVVLLGHRDTVFPQGEPTRRPFTIKGDRAYGPGVADMKAGLVMNAFVIAAYAAVGGHPAPITMLITSDEEIGSPACRPIIEAEARGARAVFNSEPSREGHVVNRGRKGGIFLEMTVTGKASHSGAAYEKGVSAIEEIARKIQALHKLTDLEAGITVNVGVIKGGQTVNTVAPWASGEIDLRFVKLEQRQSAVDAIRSIVETCTVPGATGSVLIRGEFLPLEVSPAGEKLLSLYEQAAADTGFAVSAAFSGGCADSGFTSAQGCPTICSVGPVGGLAHTPDEFCILSSLVPCAQAMARSIARIDDAVASDSR